MRIVKIELSRDDGWPYRLGPQRQQVNRGQQIIFGFNFLMSEYYLLYAKLHNGNFQGIFNFSDIIALNTEIATFQIKP